jgi:hypothetical protein
MSAFARWLHVSMSRRIDDSPSHWTLATHLSFIVAYCDPIDEAVLTNCLTFPRDKNSSHASEKSNGLPCRSHGSNDWIGAHPTVAPGLLTSQTSFQRHAVLCTSVCLRMQCCCLAFMKSIVGITVAAVIRLRLEGLQWAFGLVGYGDHVTIDV